MVTLRRIGVRSAANVGFWLGMGISIIQIMIFLVIVVLIGRVPPGSLGGDFWVRVLMSILFSAANTSIMMMIVSFIYNVVARSFGGLVLEFEPLDTADDEKPKNGGGKQRIEIAGDDNDDGE